MKKIAPLIVFVLALGWVGGREWSARENWDQYLSKKEIPTYHLLSFHADKDRNLLGFCKPCGDKAWEVAKDKMKEKADDIEKSIKGK